MSALVKHGAALRLLDLAVRQALPAGVLALVLPSSCWAGQGTATTTSAPSASSSSAHEQFSGVVRFLAPEAHAAPQHPHSTVAASRAAPAPHKTASALPTPPVPHAAPAYQTAARVYPPAVRYYDPRVVNRVAYLPYAYPRYLYPVVVWQAYGYRVVRYVYYYSYPVGYSGY